RRYLDSFRASLAAAFVGSSPAIMLSGRVFFSEIAWLAFFAGFVFHLLESEDFRKPLQATVAGIFLGLAALVRPAETTAIVIVPLIGMIAIALSKKVFSFYNAALVTGFVILSTSLLAASAFKEEIDFRLVLALGAVIIISQLLLIKASKEKEPGVTGFNFFAVSFMEINLFWWADSMPRLYSWIYSTSFGAIARITDVSIGRDGIFSVLKHIFSTYLIPNGVLVAGICLALLKPDQRRDSVSIKRLNTLTMITIGLLLPMFLLFIFTGTSDVRRVFIGMGFLLLLLAILSLQNGPLKKAREIAIAFMVAMQLAVFFLSSYADLLPLKNPALKHTFSLLMPQKSDQNEAVISRLLDLGVPKNSSVAVYTTALFNAPERIYEQDALNLAALTTGSNLRIIYFWDIGDYDAVINRLREIDVPFLLIDVYKDYENKNSYQPSVQFSTALLDKMKEPYLNPPGLQRVAAFTIKGREQVLFKVLPD
ncbi:MAG: hypothetical protein LLG40_02260, partial [Deltaproteobacteria bacterium]|nr:hypothetical protein [Deltaproteobacteria bacterium]